MTDQVMETKIFSNIVPQEQTRLVQQRTLQVLAEALSKSFGPKGSTTAITQFVGASENSNIKITHSKDGHTIVKSIQFVHPIERSVQELITNLTRFIVKEVGDGTTSAVILCSTLFNEMCNNESNTDISSADYIYELSKVINEVKTRILSMSKPCTLSDVYNICYTSTNGNENISKSLFHVYEKFGIDAYINIGISPQTENIIKEYDGMTLETGFSDFCFVNDRATNSARLQRPKIYFFEDPIDTAEMLQLFDSILGHNIMPAFSGPSAGQVAPIPTVIMCKRISPDTSAYLHNIIKLMNAHPGVVPLLIIPDIHQEDLFADMAFMSGAKMIRKYLNPDLQQKDIEQGLAPTVETVVDFCGTADEVRADALKTQLLRPKNMFNEDGSYSEDYTTLLNFLKTQIDKNIAEDAGINKIANAKRRYNTLKGNMVDFLIGGVTLSDKEALHASVEDAILNVRSAVNNGVGYGASYMAYKALYEMRISDEWSNNSFVKMLYNAYYDMIKILYKGYNTSEFDDLLRESLENNCPLNIRNNQYDHTVVSSIKTDVAILDVIEKVLSIMYTTNQYLVPNPAYNIYTSQETK